MGLDQEHFSAELIMPILPPPLISYTLVFHGEGNQLGCYLMRQKYLT